LAVELSYKVRKEKKKPVMSGHCESIIVAERSHKIYLTMYKRSELNGKSVYSSISFYYYIKS